MTRSTSSRIGDIGKDGRADAIADACLKSPTNPDLYALSESCNPGLYEKCEGRVAIVHDLSDPATIRQWAKETEPDLVIVGPEEPLEAGAVDILAQLKIPCFGPTRATAKIEWSKTWARRVVDKYGIPGNPSYRQFDSVDGLADYLSSMDDFVVKPDGLTAGKGVRVYPEHFASLDEAIECASDAVRYRGGLALIEERLQGEEFTLQTITDGETVHHCPVIQDHKRAFADDTGPNTGGMGSYSCPDLSLPFLTEADVQEASAINERVIEAIRSETGEPYRGVLYGGYMATADGVRIVEFNSRFGDPEALNVLPLLDSDFVEVAMAVATGRFHEVDIRWMRKATVCKYVVPVDYPDNKGDNAKVVVPDALYADPLVRVYWAAANWTPDGIFMTGSRAVGIVGIGDTLAEAERISEDAARAIKGPVRHRHDIGTGELVQRRVDHMKMLRR